MKRYKHRSRTSSFPSNENELKFLRGIWVLETLLRYPQVLKDFSVRRDWEDNNFMKEVMGDENFNFEDINQGYYKDILKSRLNFFKKKRKINKHQCSLTQNIKKLGEALNLSSVEKECLTFFTIVSTDKILENVVDYLGDVNTSGLVDIISTIVGLKKDVIRRALSKESSTLIRSGLLKIDSDMQNVSYKFDLLERLPDLLFQPDISTDQVFENYFCLSQPTKLNLTDFPHLEKDIEILSSLMLNDTHQNILIYGSPGVGKNLMVQCISKALSVKLHEIKMEDSEGESSSTSGKLSALRLCLSFLHENTGGNCIIFDEIEEVFDFNPFVRRSESKGYLNRLLEESFGSTTVFWLCNDTDFNPAFKRRFDYVLKMDTPPKSVRKKILSNELTNLNVSETFVDKLSEYKTLTPAIINKACKVAHISKDCSLTTEEVLEHTLSNYLTLMGDRKIKRERKKGFTYSVDYLNTNVDIKRLVEGIKNFGCASLLLSGSPGCGKSGFASYLAEMIERPLIRQKASDLLDMYVGGTEKRIRNMFNDALADDAVLLLDEADSFLQKRSAARNTWEITQINELLVQIEEFMHEGVFVCCTNSTIEQLDPAILRRMDYKIRFKYLTPDQIYRLFKELCQVDFDEYPDIKQKITQLKNITPGDFAVVERQSRLTGHKDPISAFNAILNESKIKQDGNKNQIGF